MREGEHYESSLCVNFSVPFSLLDSNILLCILLKTLSFCTRPFD
jgi:hypothetical protein